jgi:hypothetical protein
MARYQALVLPVVLLGIGLSAASHFWKAAPREVALDQCVYLGQSESDAKSRLGSQGYKAASGTAAKGELNFVSQGAGPHYSVHVGLDANHRVASASGTVARVGVPGHPELRYKEPRSEVLSALGQPASDRVDNYASRWSVYDKLKLTLVFDENDTLQRAYLADPPYTGPEETSEAN